MPRSLLVLLVIVSFGAIAAEALCISHLGASASAAAAHAGAAFLRP